MTNINIYYNKLDILLIIKIFMNSEDKIKRVKELLFKKREFHQIKQNDKWVTKEQGPKALKESLSKGVLRNF